MNFEYGSKQRFSSFMEGLHEKDIVALISHTDLDGIAAAKVANVVLDATIIKFVNYSDLTRDLVLELKERGVTKAVFTDLYLKDSELIKELEAFAHVMILDHHLSSQDWNSAKTTFIKCEEGYCAGYLCYELFSSVQNLEHLDWLVACSCVSDYCHVKTADWLTTIYSTYGDVFEQEGRYVRMSGPMWDVQDILSLSLIYYKDHEKGLRFVFDSIGRRFGDIGTLEDAAQAVRKEVDRLVALFETEKQPFEEGYLFEFEPRYSCGSMVSTIVSGKHENKTILTLRCDAESGFCNVSARRQDKQKNMSDFLKELVIGLKDSTAGGHVPAAGGHFRIEDLVTVKKRLGLKR